MWGGSGRLMAKNIFYQEMVLDMLLAFKEGTSQGLCNFVFVCL